MRLTLRAVRAVLAALLLVAVASLASPLPYAVTGRVSVVAELVRDRAGVARACAGYPLASAPGCWGPEVRGAGAIPRSQVVRLTGIWDRGALILTEPPAPAASWERTPIPFCEQQKDPTPAQARLAASLSEDPALEGAILIMPCTEGVEVVVPAPDPRLVGYLRAAYGDIAVVAWMEPA